MRKVSLVSIICTVLLFGIYFQINAGTYSFDFISGEMPSNFYGSPTVYTTFVSNGELVIDATNKGSNSEDWFDLNSDNTLRDITNDKSASFRIKSSRNVNIYLQLTDDSNRKIELYKTVYAGNGYTRLYIDLYAQNTSFDFTKVKKIKIAPDVKNYKYDRVILFIDEIRFGDSYKSASLGQLPNISYYKNTGSKTINIRKLENISNIIAYGGKSLIDTLSIENLGSRATLNFELLPDSIGKDTITVIAVGADGFVNDSTSFEITVEDNKPPFFEAIEDTISPIGVLQQITIKKISCGDKNANQSLSFSATSDNPAVIPDDSIYFHYEDYYETGTLYFNSIDIGTANISVTLKDDSGESNDSFVSDFSVTVFPEVNKLPLIDQLDDIAISNAVGEQLIQLIGIASGDEYEQPITLELSVTNPGIFSDIPEINYSGGNTASINYTPDPLTTGTSIITVIVNDHGGNVNNNGDRISSMSFEIRTFSTPPTGYIYNPVNTSDFTNPYSTVELEKADSSEFEALKFIATEKVQFDAVFLNLPEPLDLTDNLVISFDVYSPVLVNASAAFLDIDGVMGEDYIIPVAKALGMQTPNKWNHVVVRYTPNQMVRSGNSVNLEQISQVRLMVHNTFLEWQNPIGWTKWTGEAMFRNIRIGSDADADEIYTCTIDPVSAQYFSTGSDIQVELTGISGGGISGETTYTAISSNNNICSVSNMGAINPDDSTAILTLTNGSDFGTTKVTVTVNANGATSASIKFNITAFNNQTISEIAEILIDTSVKYQEIRGIGFMDDAWPDEVFTDLGATAIRIGSSGGSIEPANDNDDPTVLNMAALKKNAVNWKHIRKLHSLGVTTFHLTTWSPPSWMKLNFAQGTIENINSFNNYAGWQTTPNRLDPLLLDEFAEFMVAWVKLFRQEAGFELDAISIQNEPFISLNYSSCAMTQSEYREVLRVVGKRFQEEGINTILHGPEQAFSLNESDMMYIQADSETDSYMGAIAVHSNSDGINSDGSINNSSWKYLYNLVQSTENKKEVWATETYVNENRHALEDGIKLARDILGAVTGRVSLWSIWGATLYDIEAGEKTYYYYTAKHFCKYLTKGVKNIKCNSSNGSLWTGSFINESDSTITCIIVNNSDSRKARIVGKGLPAKMDAFRTSSTEKYAYVGEIGSDEFIVPAKSIMTLHGKFIPNGISIDPIESFIMQTNSEKTIQLSGIDNGMSSINGLSLNYSVISNENLVKNISLSSITSEGTALLKFDSGDDTGLVKFTVSLVNEGKDTLHTVFFVEIDKTTDVYQLSENKKYYVYPNPVKEVVHINTPEEFKLKSAEIYNNIGVLVHKSLFSEEGNLSNNINISTLKPGLYYLKLISENENRQTLSFIKK